MTACDAIPRKALRQREHQGVMAGIDANLERQKSAVVLLAEQMAAVNPTPAPLASWMTGKPAETLCPLHGLWMLRFTTDDLDSFSATGHRGPATCMQYVDASAGTLTNIVNYNQWGGKVKGFRVILDGAPVAMQGAGRLELTRRRVEVERRSRVRLDKISLPAGPLELPAALAISALSHLSRAIPGLALRALAALLQPPSALDLLYLDDDLRIHRAGGHVYILSRLYDVWDPASGWKVVSTI